MKKALRITALVACLIVLAAAQPVTKCQCKGISLYGRVKIVNSHADFKVKVVSSHADLHVKKVKNFPNACGKWQFVENFPDFTIQIVENFPDFKIKYVDAFPGER